VKRSFHTLDESWFDNVIQDFLTSGINQIDESSYAILELLFFPPYFLASIGEEKQILEFWEILFI